MEISQCMVKFAVEALDVLVIGLGTDSEPAEDPVDGFPQRSRAGKEPGRGQRLPSGLMGERARLCRRQYAALACPLDQIPISIEPLDRLPTPAPAHRVGEVQAWGHARQVKDPALCACLPGRHRSRFSL